MKFNRQKPPREFSPMQGIKLTDCGSIQLSLNEQVTFADGKYSSDYTKKEWGYYLANSLNYRLSEKGYKTALFISHKHNPPSIYVCTVDKNKTDLFAYLEQVEGKLVMWLDEYTEENAPIAK